MDGKYGTGMRKYRTIMEDLGKGTKPLGNNSTEHSTSAASEGLWMQRHVQNHKEVSFVTLDHSCNLRPQQFPNTLGYGNVNPG
jgi:hypothetical protein